MHVLKVVQIMVNRLLLSTTYCPRPDAQHSLLRSQGCFTTVMEGPVVLGWMLLGSTGSEGVFRVTPAAVRAKPLVPLETYFMGGSMNWLCLLAVLSTTLCHRSLGPMLCFGCKWPIMKHDYG